ncbi:MAG: tRNA (adenosine(37)-N6)-threonylcarbamoyltransferase complex ATPase subunit type 1 TsaE [Planctomycetota bacterium]
MIRIERPCHSLDATARMAADLAAVLRAGDIVRLDGDMGAGKTTLVRSIAEAFGVESHRVTSPTYALMNVYEPRAGLPPIAHLDCYRMGSGDELDALGWDRVADGSAVVLIEWAERMAETLPANTPQITATAIGEHARSFVLSLPATWEDRAGFPGLETRPDTTCPITGSPVSGDSPTWPFADERARMADLHGWISGNYTISRPIEQRDLEEE